jgi:hypothetical protein
VVLLTLWIFTAWRVRQRVREKSGTPINTQQRWRCYTLEELETEKSDPPNDASRNGTDSTDKRGSDATTATTPSLDKKRVHRGPTASSSTCNSTTTSTGAATSSTTTGVATGTATVATKSNQNNLRDRENQRIFKDKGGTNGPGEWAPSVAGADSVLVLDPYTAWLALTCCHHFVHLDPIHQT